MAQRLHLITNNAKFLRPPTVQVSTIDLPSSHLGMWYETAVLTEHGIDEIERYETMAEAVEGHQRWARKMNCSNEVVV